MFVTGGFKYDTLCCTVDTETPRQVALLPYRSLWRNAVRRPCKLPQCTRRDRWFGDRLATGARTRMVLARIDGLILPLPSNLRNQFKLGQCLVPGQRLAMACAPYAEPLGISRLSHGPSCHRDLGVGVDGLDQPLQLVGLGHRPMRHPLNIAPGRLAWLRLPRGRAACHQVPLKAEQLPSEQRNG